MLSMRDYLVKAQAYQNTVRIYAAVTTGLVNESQRIQQSWPTATAALGRVLTASALMGAMYKDDESITIRIDGGGPIGNIVADANGRGEVRGYVSNPQVFIQYHSGEKEGKLNVGAAVGTDGFLQITKDLRLKDFFTSSTLLQTGEIAEDFTYYFAVSEQTPSSVGLGVLVDTDNTVIASGGFILQLMPGCSEETVEVIEKVLKNMKPTSKMIEEGYTAEQIIEALAPEDHHFLEILPLSYHCGCSSDKFLRGIASLGEEEIQNIIIEDGHAEAICHFCGTKYTYSEDELRKVIVEGKE